MIPPKGGWKIRTISPSQLREMGCSFSWWLKYPMGYRAIRLNPALDFGTAIHEALHHHYLGNDIVKVFEHWMDAKERTLEWDDDIDALRDLRSLGIKMLEGYAEKYQEETFDVLHLEETIRRRIPIPNRKALSMCNMVVRLDGLVRDHSTGKLFSLEHKTFSRFSLSDLELDQQFTAQIWTGQKLASSLGLDEPVVGVIWNGLRKQAPGPRVKLALFERHIIYRNQQQIKALLYRAYWKYIQMKTSRVFPEPNPMRCSRCDFRIVCEEFQRGGDWEYILENHFTKRGEKNGR